MTKIKNEMIKKTIVLSGLLLLLNVGAYAQKSKDKVLLKIDDTPVYLSEFVRLFHKNRDLTSTVYDREAVKNDLELFIDYKLKLIEATALKMDTAVAYKKEVLKYREQLALPYLTDDKYIDSLTLEAYERSKKEVRASHILIRLNEKSKDTAEAFQKISEIREEILEGTDFAVAAKKYSEDPSAKTNEGDLNYFTVFRMVTPFENMAYTTKLGEVSPVFRTRFGYHILKVTDIRDSEGEVEVAHIMNRDRSEDGKILLNKVYDEIQNGADFGSLAQKFSDDKRSASNGGKLQKFSMGSMPPPFDEVSFSLSDEKPYSKPFQTAYGWHIVKFIKRYPIGDFESSKEALKRKVKSDPRSKNLANPVTERLKKEYNIVINEAAKKTIGAQKTDSLNLWLLKIEDETYHQKDFAQYLKKQRNQYSEAVFEKFVDRKILDYYKEHLEDTNEDFKNIFEEYKNGLLLFDLMQNKVWDVARKDTLGLQRYYNQNSYKYKTNDRITAIVVRAKEAKLLEGMHAYFSNLNDIDSLDHTIANKEGLIMKAGDFEKTAAIFPKKITFVPNTIETYKEKEYTTLVKILKIKEGVQPLFSDVKGKVSNDFQEYIENKWIRSLREKHKIKVYKSRLRTAKKLLNS